jgi:GxxExxY protein
MGKEQFVFSFGFYLALDAMHSFYNKASGLTETVIAGAIEVHRDKGPGLIESIYEWCLLMELGLRGYNCVTQKAVSIHYKGFTREEPLRFDILVENCLLVEAKAVEKILPIHKAKLMSYMKLLNMPVGLLINFHEIKVTDGVHRLVLTSKPMKKTERKYLNRRKTEREGGEKGICFSLSYLGLPPVQKSVHLAYWPE